MARVVFSENLPIHFNCTLFAFCEWQEINFKFPWSSELCYISLPAQEKKCPVCLGLFDEEDEVKQLPCSHRFHSTCIIPWLQRVSENEMHLQ